MERLSRSSIRFIVTCHERGAAFMDDAYGLLMGPSPDRVAVERAASLIAQENPRLSQRPHNLQRPFPDRCILERTRSPSPP